MSGDDLFDVVCDDLDDATFRMPEKYVITVLDAINYIAYGRFDGPEQPRHWSDYEEERVEHDLLVWYGSRNVACRLLEHQIATGNLRVHVVDTVGEGEMERLALYAVKPRAFQNGAGVFFHGGASRSRQFIIQSGDDTILIHEGFFFAEDIKCLASPSEGAALTQAQAQPATRPEGARGGRKAGKNGAPIAGFLKRVNALGYDRIVAETQETLGAWLREEYASRGLQEPHADNARRDAVGAMRDWFGVSAEG